MEVLLKVSTPKKYGKGTKICGLEDNQSLMYVIADGKVCVIISESESEQTYEKLVLGKGDFFGGLGLVAGGKKSIEVIALTQVVVLETSMDRIQTYKKDHPEGGLFYVELMKMYTLFSNKVKDSLLEKSEDRMTYISGEALVSNEEQHSMIMPKSFKCPICGNEFKNHVVRGTKLQMEKRGDFFMTEYKDIDPLWYEIIVCPECAYAEKLLEFSLPIQFNEVKIKEAMAEAQKVIKHSYSDYRTSEEVARAYALHNKCLEAKDSDVKVMGRSALVTYEFYRRLGDASMAELYRDKAFDYYKGMFKSGILDVTDSQMQQLYIIIGKLHEHRGEYGDAKNEYRNAKMLRGDVDPKYAELADEFLMDLDDLIKG